MGKLNSLERTIGLEFEFSNPKGMTDDDVTEIIAAAGPEWVRDGSLREGGRELVTSPLQGDAFLEAITSIMAAIQKFTPEIDSRCGFHVHVGAVDFSWSQLRNLIIAWCGIEKDVFAKLVRADRKKNHYCIPLRSSTPPQGPSYAQYPWQMTKATLAELGTLTTGSEIEQYLVQQFYRVPLNSREFKQMLKNKRAHGEGSACFRYSALNLHSWWYRHTIEFRLKEGTLDIGDCIYWPLFCGWFIENIAHMRLEEAQQVTSMKSFLDIGKVPKKIKAWVQEKLEKEQEPAPTVELARERVIIGNRAVSRLQDMLNQVPPPTPRQMVVDSVPTGYAEQAVPTPPEGEPLINYQSYISSPVFTIPSYSWTPSPRIRRTR